MPTYNDEKHIASAIQSVVNQSYTDWELLIMDDGSKDNTNQIVNSYNLPNIKYIRSQKNNGPGFSRNALLNSFNSDYACWLDSDDMMSSNRIEKNLFNIKDKDILYSQFVKMNDLDKYSKQPNIINVDLYSKDNFQSLKNNTACATGFFKKTLKKIKFKEDITLGSEDVLWIWELLQNDYKIGYINEPLYFYRQHDNRIGVQKRRPEFMDLKKYEDGKVAEYIENIKKK